MLQASTSVRPARKALPQRTKREEFSYPTIALTVTLLHCLYVLVWYLQLGSRWDFLGAIRFEFLLVGCLTLIAFFHLPIARPSPFQGRLLRAVALFVLCVILALIFSYDFEISWLIFVDRLIKFSFTAFFIIVFVRGPLQLKFFLAAFLLACIKIGQEGFYGTVTGNMLWENQGIPRLHGGTGLFAHPNSLSGLALGTLPFVYYLFPLVPRWGKFLLGLQAIFALTIVVATGSRTGYVGFLFMLLFLVMKSRHKAKLLFGMFVLGVALSTLVVTSYRQRFESMFTGQEIEGDSMGARKIILRDAITVLRRHPFGVGVAAFPAVRNMYFGRQQDTHNLYLEVATNLGIQGLVAFLTFVYLMLKALTRTRHSVAEQLAALQASDDSSATHRGHVDDLRLMEATANAVSVFLLARLVVGFFGHDLYEIYWWFALGLTVALLNMNVWAKQRTEQLLMART